MKKILSSVLCLAMMLSMGTVAFAETNDFVLTYSNEASYEISIPASGNVDKSTGKGVILIETPVVNVGNNQIVAVSISSANYNDGWKLVNTKDNSDTISYNIGTTDGASDITNNELFMTAIGSGAYINLYVSFEDLNSLNQIGTFTDTITFTSEIKDVIHFTIDGMSYSATDGMTWEDWTNSRFNTAGLFCIDGYDMVYKSDSETTYEYLCNAAWTNKTAEIISGEEYQITTGYYSSGGAA